MYDAKSANNNDRSGIKPKLTALFAVLLLIALSATTLYSINASSESNGTLTNTNYEVPQGSDDWALSDYGITYEDFCSLMDSLSGKALVIFSEKDVLTASFESSIDAGRFGAEVQGHYFYVYLDSISTNALLGGGSAVVGAAIGAAVGSAVPGLGTLLGTGLGAFLAGAIEGALNTMIVEGLHIENGVVVEFQYMDTYRIFGVSFDFICSPKITNVYPQ